MAAQNDFLAAVNQIAAERNIDANEVIEAIKAAIISGFRQDGAEEENEGSNLTVDIDSIAGSIKVFADKKVVKEVSTPATQIALEDAKKLESKIKVGDHIQVDITPTGDFGRVAAQAAKQVILQKIRESEKEAVMVEFKDKVGEIDYAVVQRLDGDNVIFEIRRAIAIMPQEDRIPIEFYKSGARLKVLIKEIRMTPRGKQLIVSRADPNFLIGLFKLEVPEILSGSVEVKAIAREAGSRSKIAVYSNSEGVDPIGACIGQKGVRINAILNELRFGPHEEKVDVIPWTEEIFGFIANALSPAQVLKIEVVNADEKHARAIVPDDQVSLGIGKEGQNVRLAAKLTGWKIDVVGETASKQTESVKAESTEAVESTKEEVIIEKEAEDKAVKPKKAKKTKAKSKAEVEKPAKKTTKKTAKKATK